MSPLNSGHGSAVWTINEMKYCPAQFMETVAVPIFPSLTRRVKTNLSLLSHFFYFRNFGIWIFLALKSIFIPAGTSKLWLWS